MAAHPSTTHASPSPRDEFSRGDLVYTFFYRDYRAITCAVGLEGDGTPVVQVTRLWDDETFVEVFERLEDALERHAEIATFLHDSGWLLVERAAAPAAA